MEKNRLTLEPLQVNLLNKVPFPPMMRNALTHTVVSLLNNQFCRMEHNRLHLDVLGATGLPLVAALKDLRVEEGRIALEIGSPDPAPTSVS